MLPTASQPTRASSRETRRPERFRGGSQPVVLRRLSPPPSPPRVERPVVQQPGVGLEEEVGAEVLHRAPMRLEIIGIGEEQVIVELEELVHGDMDGDAGGEEAEEIEGGELVGAEDGNRIDLRPFTDAMVPGPLQGPIPEDAEGWSQIDTWDAFDCSVSSIVPMEEVPGPFRKPWASALATVLKRVNLALAAGDQADLDRSMKWLLALPKLLLRQPRRGGERGQGSGEVAARFEAVRQSSWGSLLPPLHRDEVAEKKRRDRKKQ